MRKITLNDFFGNRAKKSNRWQQMLAIGFGLMVGHISNAQTIGDYASGFSQSMGTYTPLTGETVLWSGYDGFDDDATTINLSTPFNYLGTNYSSIFVSANGNIKFGSTSTTNTVISSGTFYAVAPFAVDLDAKAASAGTGLPSVSWKEEGNEIIIQWANVCRYTSSGASSAENLNFQIRLNTSNSEIKIVYGNCVDRATPSTTYPQVGLAAGSTTLFSNRTIAAGGGDWVNSAAGAAAANTMAFNGATKPSNGLTFKWTLPSCYAPGALNVSGVTPNSAILGWNGTGSNFDVKWGTVGFDVQTAGTLIENVSSGYTLPGLSSNTNYSFYVRNECSAGDFSIWSGPYSFWTDCEAVTSFPWTENFNSVTTPNLPNCWSKIDANNDGDSFITYTGGYGVSGSIAVGLYTDFNSGNNNDYLILPAFDLTGNQRLKFSVRSRTTGEPNDYRVVLSTTDRQAASFTTELMPLTVVSWATHQEINWIDLSNYSGVTHIAIHVPSGGLDGYYIYFDDFRVEDIPSCLPVTDIVVSNKTHNSATFNWTSAGNDFDIKWGAPGFAPATAGTLVENFANGSTLGGLTPLTNYEFYVRQDCGVNGYSLWTGPISFKTECLPPSLTGTTPGEVCGLGEVTLSATADSGASIAWFNSATGNVKVGEGATFTTPTISETTSYWAAAFVGTTGNGARLAPVYTSGSYTTAADYGLVFTANDSFTLNTVDVYLVGTAGNLIVKLTNTSGTTLETKTIALPALGSTTTPQVYTITLDFDIEPGDYRLLAQSSPNMVRESALGGFPYQVGDVATITNGYISGTSTNYYYFYNWAFSAGCMSDRTEVVATVTNAPSFAISESTIEICNGDTSAAVTISEGASNYDTFVWTPSTGVIGDATTGWTFNPTETTTYTLSVSQSTGAECSSVETVTVNVNNLPAQITVVGEDITCENETVELSVTGNINSGTAVFGEGTTVPSNTSWPNPFSKWWGGNKHQMLYTADELMAQGLIAGSEITAVTFDIANINTSANNVCTEFTIRMGNTSVNAMTSFVSGTTNVYGPADFIPTQTGIVMFELSTPYVWDGVSNLVVETIHNSGTSGGGAGTNTRATTTTNNSVYRAASDNVTNGVAGFDALTTYGSAGTALNLRPNMTFIHSMEQTAITWSPATNLYTDAAATVAYVADSYATTVYYKPTAAGVTTYVASSFNDAGCFVSDSIEITVNATSVTPTGDANQALNIGATLADLVVTGTDLTWYADAALTTVIPNTTVVVDGTTYYVTSTTNPCESSALAITVTLIDPCAGISAPTADLTQTLNESQTVADIVVTGENLTWYSDEDLTTEVEETFVLEVGTYTFYVTQTIGECTSTAIAIEVTVVDPCVGTPAPTADSPQAMTVGQTVADIAVDGENLTWYSDEDLTTEVEETFVLEEGSYTFYVTQTIGDCTSEAIEVVVEVSLSTGGFDVMSFKAYPNPVKDIFTISYSKNIADVTVVNMLGQIVVKQTVQSTDAQINMSALPAGNYVVKVAVDGAVQTLKVVKQ